MGLWPKRKNIDTIQDMTLGFEDTLQLPLQPLSDHLESSTYEGLKIFGKSSKIFQFLKRTRSSTKSITRQRWKQFKTKQPPVLKTLRSQWSARDAAHWLPKHFAPPKLQISRFDKARPEVVKLEILDKIIRGWKEPIGSVHYPASKRERVVEPGRGDQLRHARLAPRPHLGHRHLGVTRVLWRQRALPRVPPWRFAPIEGTNIFRSK